MSEPSQRTPIEIIARVSRIVTMAVDRITGDRSDYPLLAATACREALERFGIRSLVMYGHGAWIEVLEDHSVVWAGCWGENSHFWVATQHGEVVDLNTSVAHRKRAQGHGIPEAKALYSPPILWSIEIPRFYRYAPHGIAEVEPAEGRDRRWLELVLLEIREKCGPESVGPGEPIGPADFPNESILCPDRRILDDSKGSFRLFDRALSVKGIPQPPF